MERRIIRNSLRTPDGTILTSNHVHDFKMYVDKNNETYINDGGTDYLRRSINKEPFEDLSVYSDSPFEDIREAVTWGTFGKEGTSELQRKKLSELSSPHIEAILKNCNISEFLTEMFHKELDYRNSCEVKSPMWSEN